jgi:hypothetical protein
LKLNRSGVAACSVYLVAVVWLIERRYFETQPHAMGEAEFYLVIYPLWFLGLPMFGPEEFWIKYGLFFFPLCFVFFYFMGCGIGWILGFEKLRKPPESS